MDALPYVITARNHKKTGLPTNPGNPSDNFFYPTGVGSQHANRNAWQMSCRTHMSYKRAEQPNSMGAHQTPTRSRPMPQNPISLGSASINNQHQGSTHPQWLANLRSLGLAHLALTRCTRIFIIFIQFHTQTRHGHGL